MPADVRYMVLPPKSPEPVKAITSFENDNPFEGAEVVADHASDGAKALRIAGGYAIMEAKQDWSGYDYLKADVHTDSKRPLELTIEIRDTATKGYWTRVNYTTVVPPGTSTLIIPTSLYVGEKSRPGRPLNRREITHLVFSIGESPRDALFLDNVRLERDTQSEAVRFDGLWAFDLGSGTSPLMEGFEQLDVNKTYSKGRGYGWKNADFWRTFDALQPEPLYQDFISVQSGGLALDVPNGRYRVFVNMDSPSGYWGEYQRYRHRALVLEGKRHVDTMDLARFKQKYFRFHDSEDLPTDNTFDKYQKALFDEKLHTVEVNDGQLNIDFEGENWACSVSAIVVFPESKAAMGERFLQFTQQRRRFHFDNYFKRVLHEPTGNAGSNTSSNSDGGNMTVFARDPMRDVYYNDRSEDGERVEKLTVSAFAGEYEPVTFSIIPQRDLGNVTVSVGELKSDDGATLSASSIDIGYVQYRLSRLTYEGSVYTIAPRFVMPRNNVQCPKGVTRRFWMTLRVPDNARSGVYRGQLTIRPEHGNPRQMPIEVIVRKGSLDPIDIPVGPWGHTVDLPWFDDEAAEWNDALAMKSLQKLREYGFTTCTGLPIVRYDGFKDGNPLLDFSVGDAQMKRLRHAGFELPVVSYCPLHGLDLYYKDETAMQQAGFDDYAEFIRAIFTAVQKHADETNWLPVYWNIGDEPVDDDLRRSAENASAYRKAFPNGPPFFAAASSFTGSNKDDPHFQLSKSLHVANWNSHDEASVKLQHDAGGDWAFYNGGNRWTYGVYMFKTAKQFRMKWRLDWHWNMNAGHPYYALDCREDDYAWCSSTPDGDLIPTVAFERLREGVDDYRRLLTISRLVKANPATNRSRIARKQLTDLVASFQLGDREVTPERYSRIRAQLDNMLDSLR